MMRLLITIFAFSFSFTASGAREKSVVDLPQYCETFKVELSARDARKTSFNYVDESNTGLCPSIDRFGINNNELVVLAETITSTVQENHFRREGNLLREKLLNTAVENLYENKRKYLELNMFPVADRKNAGIRFNFGKGLTGEKYRHLNTKDNDEMRSIYEAQQREYDNSSLDENSRQRIIQETQDKNRDDFLQFNFFKAVVAKARLKQISSFEQKESERLDKLKEDFKNSSDFQTRLNSCYARESENRAYNSRGTISMCPFRSRGWIRSYLEPIKNQSKENIKKVKAPLYKLAQQSPLLFDAETSFSVTDWVNFEPAESRLSSALIRKAGADSMVDELAALFEAGENSNEEVDFNQYFSANSERTSGMLGELLRKDKKTLIGRRETSSLYPILYKSVVDHVFELNESATKIMNRDGSGLQHSAALVQRVLSSESDREDFQNGLAGQCYLLQTDREREVSYGWRTYLGAGLAAVGTGLQFVPVVGNAVGTGVLVAGGALAGVEAVENYDIANKNLGNAQALNELGLVSYEQFLERKNAHQDAINDIGLELFVLADLAAFSKAIRGRQLASSGGVSAGARASSLPERSIVEQLGLDNFISQTDLAPNGSSAFRDETLLEIENVFNSLGTLKKEEALSMLSEISDPQKKSRYMMLLLNSSEDVPLKTLSRIKRLEADPSVLNTIVDEIDVEINNLTQSLKAARLSGDINLSKTLARQRSDLMMQRFLLEAGDDIQIDSIVSANSHNQLTESQNRQAHSLSDSFLADIRVKEGSNIQLCRGSYGAIGAVSTLTGSFLTICRSDNYLGRASLGDALAAPSVESLRGYTRMNRFEVPGGTELTLGRNGAVEYSEGAIAGSGGNGGGIEFFTSRSGYRVTPQELRGSVRVPRCAQGSAGCDEVFRVQERIRGNKLVGTSSENRDLLMRESAVLDGVIGNVEGGSLSSFSASSRNGGSAQEAIETLARENPDLYSAMTVKQEVILKIEQNFAGGNPERLLDRESQRLAENSSLVVRAAEQFDSSTVVAPLEFINNHPIVSALKSNRSRIEALFLEVGKTTVEASQREILQEIVSLQNQQQDLIIPLQGLAYQLSKSTRFKALEDAPSVTSLESHLTRILEQ